MFISVSKKRGKSLAVDLLGSRGVKPSDVQQTEIVFVLQRVVGAEEAAVVAIQRDVLVPTDPVPLTRVAQPHVVPLDRQRCVHRRGGGEQRDLV